jgi:hydroxypyruvate isomerase
MLSFSANLGFLWKEKTLAQAIHLAANAGFSAVECHWPYDQPVEDVARALQETGLPMLGLNTRPGNTANRDFGLSALTGREEEAREAITQAVAYASAIKAHNIHVMAGKTSGKPATDTFVSNLRFACEEAASAGIGILIEPINTVDVPGYFLNTIAQAADICSQVDKANIAIMFDCYHVARMDFDVEAELDTHFAAIGHVQFAGVPDRGPPHEGTLDYDRIFAKLESLGQTKPVGAEYRPVSTTDASLGWLERARSGKSLLSKS